MENHDKLRWRCTSDFIYEMLEEIKKMTIEERVNLCVKVLNAENVLPSSDMVSRKEYEKMRDCARRWQDEFVNASEIANNLLANKDDWWHLCKDELPSECEEVIVSVRDDSADNVYNYTTVAWMFDNGRWISDNDFVRGEVIAWMSLPKPYEENK